MLDHVPALQAKQPGLAVRAAGAFLGGVRDVTEQIEPYTHWWSEQNQQALRGKGPLMVVIGDSTAIGIGASHPGNGYVGRVVGALDRSASTTAVETRWRVINLAQSGAKFEDGLDRQLPIADKLPPPDLLIGCLGSNDLVWGLNTTGLRRLAREYSSKLTSLATTDGHTILCPVAGASGRARLVNRAIRSEAKHAGASWVNPWNEPGPGPSQRLSSDRFHPNDLGYALMATALGRHLEVDAGQALWIKAEEQARS